MYCILPRKSDSPVLENKINAILIYILIFLIFKTSIPFRASALSGSNVFTYLPATSTKHKGPYYQCFVLYRGEFIVESIEVKQNDRFFNLGGGSLSLSLLFIPYAINISIP